MHCSTSWGSKTISTLHSTDALAKPGPAPLRMKTADGTMLGGFVWHAASSHAPRDRPVVIINAATSVRCRYYFHFARFLCDHGFDIIAYDYRGIGESRPETLRGLQASWVDWGREDFEAILRWAVREFPGQPIDVVAHSIGGFVTGLAPSNHLIRSVFTMGAQYAFWRDYAPSSRLQMLLKWHLAMPVLTAGLGYFPGHRLGWMEDTPKGVVRDWSRSRARFEDTRRGPARMAERAAIVAQFGAMTARILALSVTDDPFGTVPAVERLLSYFTGCPRTHLRIGPEMIGTPKIGHFAFFNKQFKDTLWPIPLAWLQSQEIPAAFAHGLLPRPVEP